MRQRPVSTPARRVTAARCCTAGVSVRGRRARCAGPRPRAPATWPRPARAPAPRVRPTASPPNGTSCSDGNVCNGAETCQNGTCTAGTALVCNDNNVCTTDTCNPSTGCVFTNNTGTLQRRHRVHEPTSAPAGACQSTPSCPGGPPATSPPGSCDVPAGSYRSGRRTRRRRRSTRGPTVPWSWA